MESFDLPTLEPAGPVIQSPIATPEELEEQRLEAIEEGRAAGHAEGFAHGQVEGRELVLPALAALSEAVDGLGAERDRVCQIVESAALDLAFAIAEQVIGGQLAAQPATIVEIVRGALRRLVERERVIVLVNPDDLELMRDAAPGLVAELGGIEHCEVQAERRVDRGGAVVRTAEGEIDATVRTKLERVREVIAEDLADA